MSSGPNNSGKALPPPQPVHVIGQEANSHPNSQQQKSSQGQKIETVTLPNNLSSLTEDLPLEGRVISKNTTGQVVIATDRGDITVQLRANQALPENLQLLLKAGTPPTLFLTAQSQPEAQKPPTELPPRLILSGGLTSDLISKAQIKFTQLAHQLNLTVLPKLTEAQLSRGAFLTALEVFSPHQSTSKSTDTNAILKQQLPNDLAKFPVSSRPHPPATAHGNSLTQAASLSPFQLKPSETESSTARPTSQAQNSSSSPQAVSKDLSLPQLRQGAPTFTAPQTTISPPLPSKGMSAISPTPSPALPPSATDVKPPQTLSQNVTQTNSSESLPRAMTPRIQNNEAIRQSFGPSFSAAINKPTTPVPLKIAPAFYSGTSVPTASAQDISASSKPPLFQTELTAQASSFFKTQATHPPLPKPVLLQVEQILPQSASIRVGAPLQPDSSQVTKAHQIMTAEITGKTLDGQPILSTGKQNYVLQNVSQLDMGTKLSISLIAEADWFSASEERSATAGHKWDNLRDAFLQLGQQSPQLLPQLADRLLPQPNEKLSSTLLVLLSALRGGSFEGWLSEETDAKLDPFSRLEFITKLREDFQNMSRQTQQSETQEWRLYQLPILGDETLSQLNFYLHNQKEGSGTQDPDSLQQRFLIEISLSELGDIQLDGLVQKKKLDLIFRSEKYLDSKFITDLQTIFLTSLEAISLKGSLTFQQGKEQFISPLPVEEHSSYLV